MKRIIVTDSGSASSAASTDRLPAGTHENRWNTTWRSCSSRLRISANTATDTPKEPNISSVASQPDAGSPSRRPRTSSTTTPASGSAGTSQMSERASISASAQGPSGPPPKAAGAGDTAGLSATKEPTTRTRSTSQSPLQHRNVVGGRAGAAPEDGDDDAEADHDLGRRHDEHEEHDDLAPDV